MKGVCWRKYMCQCVSVSDHVNLKSHGYGEFSLPIHLLILILFWTCINIFIPDLLKFCIQDYFLFKSVFEDLLWVGWTLWPEGKGNYVSFGINKLCPQTLVLSSLLTELFHHHLSTITICVTFFVMVGFNMICNVWNTRMHFEITCYRWFKGWNTTTWLTVVNEISLESHIFEYLNPHSSSK